MQASSLSQEKEKVMNMDEMREEYDAKKSAPRKLRGICKSYRAGEAPSSSEEEPS